MKCIVWGTGDYCKDKLNWNHFNHEIIAFADRSIKEFNGQKTILIDDICKMDYDYVVVMSGFYLEIIPDLIEANVPFDKIIPGCIFRPYYNDEIVYMSHNTGVEVLESGEVRFSYDDGYEKAVQNKDDLNDLKKHLNKTENVNNICSLDTRPVGKLFGHDRGGSISRYYLESFLEENKSDVYGNVMEVGSDGYIKRFGSKDVVPHVLYYSKDADEKGVAPKEYIYGDLETGVNIPEAYFDCMILTQVMDFLFDAKSAANIIKKSLKKGGVALLTMGGISPISRSDMDRYGHYWNYTIESARRLFEGKGYKTEVKSYGNSKSACGFLQGMAPEDFSKDDLDYLDEDFQVIIGVRVERLI